MDLLDTFNGVAGGLAVLVFIIIFALGVICSMAWVNYAQRRNGAVNQRRGRRAEMNACTLLESEGFEILDAQPHFTSSLMVNGDLSQFDITPDFLVVKDGVRYVVEVKSFNDRTGVANAGVRRQVMEYLHATGLPCLLVRMPGGDIDMIELPEA